MRKMLIVLAVLLEMAGGAYAQIPYRIYTNPKLPARDALERMQLVIAWNMRVKVLGNRDGLFSVQVIPGDPYAQVVAQTYEGAVYLFDAEHGDLIWKTKVGLPYWTPQPVGYNSQNIFATRRNMLHIIDRFNGTQRVYRVDSRTKDTTYGFEMQGAPSAAPIADEDTLYVSMSDRVNAIDIPDFVALEKGRIARETIAKTAAKEKAKDEENRKDLYKEEKDGYRSPEDPLAPGSLDSPQPGLLWGYRLPGEVTEFSPLIHGEQLSVLSTAGNLLSVNRFGGEDRLGKELFEFRTTGRVAAAAGQHGAIAFVASDDFNLYAVNMRSGRMMWRYVSGAPIMQKPEVNDEYVFVVPQNTGIRCIDRFNGSEIWRNRDASRFLAANNKFVYAIDRYGKFFVLDARRGTTLARYDLSDWAVPVPNDMTDRIYLAANDGQILCLRHRDLVKPLTMKTLDVVKKDEKKPMEERKKKDDEKKEEEKKKDDEKKEEKKKDDARFEQRVLPPRMIHVAARVESDDRSHALEERRSWAGR